MVYRRFSPCFQWLHITVLHSCKCPCFMLDTFKAVRLINKQNQEVQDSGYLKVI